MKKVIREVDEERGILQVTIADERWYVKEEKDAATELPVLRYVPSVTWICGHYPKGIGFYKWLAEHGWDESQAIKQAAGDKGSKVHDAISAILRGEEVRIDSEFLNRSNDKMEELTLEEVDGIKSLVDWKNVNEPIHLAWDLTVFSEKFGYAGTIDYICKVGDEVYLIDFKTSAQVWPEYELQVSAYKQALVEMQARGDFAQIGDMSQAKLAILQVGYSKNKAGYKWNEVEDQFPLFMAARQIWAKECEGQQPKKRDYPIVLSPAITVDEAMAESDVQTQLPAAPGKAPKKKIV
jgi:PD-(D/E)XK nuclease superfamily protein